MRATNQFLTILSTWLQPPAHSVMTFFRATRRFEAAIQDFECLRDIANKHSYPVQMVTFVIALSILSVLFARAHLSQNGPVKFSDIRRKQ